MKKNLLLLLFIVGAALNVWSTEQSVFKVQGHERNLQTLRKNSKTKPLSPRNVEDKDFTFDDIKYWVGEGDKRAALVIDWFDNKGQALVWGFKWSGEATGYDMIKAIAAADSRFLVLTHSTNLGNTIAGLGYDINYNGNRKLIFNKEPFYPEEGLIITSQYNYDDWSSPDASDHWHAGWYNGYWSYQVKDTPADDFSYSGLGASTRLLTDGCWDGWGYQDGWDGMDGVMPRAPYQAAEISLFQDYRAYWSEMGKDSSHQTIVNSLLPRSNTEITERWKTLISNTWISGGQPIIVNGNVYLAVNNKLMIIDAITGSVIKESTLDGSCGFFSMIAYGEGKIFVPLGDGVLQAFNAETLESIWKTEKKTGYQQLCPVAYHDGNVYSGMWKGGKPSQGSYYCVSAKDENAELTNEIKSYTWESTSMGHYWAGATIVGDAIIYGGENGLLESRNRLTGELIDQYQLDATLTTSTIRSGTSYDITTKMIYFTGKETSKVYGIKISAGGTFDKDNVLSQSISGQTTTVPTVFNGRVYVTSGTMTSSGGLDVLDAATLKKIYTANIGGISQSTPLISTGYATPENNNTVYIYLCLNNKYGNIVCMKDFEGNENPIIQFTYEPTSIQYSTHSLVADEEGTLYYKNDAKYLFALATSPSQDTSVESVTLNVETLSIEVANTMQLQATLLPTNATNTIIDWESSHPEIATVDNKGIVSGVKEGNATVSATSRDGNIIANCAVTITDLYSSVDDVTTVSTTVYPNPFVDHIVITTNINTKATIYDIAGNTIVNTPIVAGANKINLSTLATGIYIIKCGTHTQKLLKK